MGGHAGTSLITYASGHRVVLRHVSDLVPPRFYEHQYPVTVARISPNGQWVASGDVSGRVRVWGLNEDMTLKAEHHPLSGAVDDMAWSDDGQRIVCCGEGKQSFAKVFLWDSGSAVGDVSGSTKRVNSCDFRPCRPFRIATASEDFAVSFYEGPPFKFARTPHRHGNFANCVRFSPDGAKFASVGSDGAGVVYDGRTGAPIAELPAGGKPAGGTAVRDAGGHVGTIYACAWSPDSSSLLTAGADKTCKLWAVPRDLQGDLQGDFQGDAATTASSLSRLEKLAEHSFGQTVGDMQVGCAFVGDVAVTLSLSGNLNVIHRVDVPSSESSNVPAGPENPSGNREYIGNRVVRSGHPKPIGALAVCKSSGDAFSASLSAIGGGAQILRWRDGDGCVANVRGPGHTSAVIGAVCVRGKYLVTAGLDDCIRVASIETDSSYVEGEGSSLKLPAQPRSMGADDAGSLVAVATGDGVMACTFDGTLGTLGTLVQVASTADADSGQIKREPTSVCVRGDGREVAVGCKDGAVRLFSVVARDAGAGSESGGVGSESGGAGSDPRPSFSLVLGGTLTRHRGEVTACAYSPDGTRLATCDANREVLVWDPSKAVVVVDKMVYHRARVTCVGWSVDGARLATGALDGRIIAWDTSKPIASEGGRAHVDGAHVGGVTCLEWRDVNTIVSGGFDACVRTWTLP